MGGKTGAFVKKNGFDNALYVQKQTEQIKKRIASFGNKLYLEFGGKLFDDFHAGRVLPGFDVNGKIRLLLEFKEEAEIVFCINAADIEKNKIRADLGISYDMDVMRLIDNIRKLGLYVSSVVITQYLGQPAADVFKDKLAMRGMKVYIHRHTKGYPSDTDTIVSDEGYGANPYIETSRPLVIITAPGPGSGKLATCLSQLYHEYKRGIQAGYAKFETFPIWNIPLKHPVNLAYEAATADLKDVNMIDPFHLETYGETAVNYNRDVEVFPIVKTILTKIMGDPNIYNSPTDMGVNMAGYGICDDEAVRNAAKQEIVRRYYKAGCEHKLGRVDQDTVRKIELLMQQAAVSTADRAVVGAALDKAARYENTSAVAIELNDGTMITGRTSELMSASSAVVLNAVKVLAGIADEVLLLSPVVLEPMMKLKNTVLKNGDNRLHLDEALIALSICAANNSMVKDALDKLGELKGCEAHSTTMLRSDEEGVFRKLGINLTCEPEFPTRDLFFM